MTINLNLDRRDERRSEWEERQGRERGREEQEKRVGKEKQREDSVSSDEGGKKVKQGRLSGSIIFIM